MTGELNLKRTTISNTSCSLVAETLKRVRTIKILNLADCLLKFDGLKYFLDVVNQQKSLSLLNLKGNKIGNNITLYVANIMLTNYSITEYVIKSYSIRSIDFKTIMFINMFKATVGLEHNG